MAFNYTVTTPYGNGSRQQSKRLDWLAQDVGQIEIDWDCRISKINERKAALVPNLRYHFSFNREEDAVLFKLIWG